MGDRTHAGSVVVALATLACLTWITSSHQPHGIGMNGLSAVGVLANASLPGAQAGAFQRDASRSLQGEGSPTAPLTRKQEQLLEFRSENAFKDDLALFWMPSEWRDALSPFVQVRATPGPRPARGLASWGGVKMKGASGDPRAPQPDRAALPFTHVLITILYRRVG